MVFKKKIIIAVLGTLGILGAAAGVSWSKKIIVYLPSDEKKSPISSDSALTNDHAWTVYRDEQHGLELQHPDEWLSYGNKNEFSIPDLLSWRGFVPDYDTEKSLEEQPLIQVSVWNKNPNSPFRPSELMKHTNKNELWQPVSVNNYQATQITNPNLKETKTYVFDHDGKLYVIDASESIPLEKILPTVKFF